LRHTTDKSMPVRLNTDKQRQRGRKRKKEKRTKQTKEINQKGNKDRILCERLRSRLGQDAVETGTIQSR